MTYHLTPNESGSYTISHGIRHRFIFVQLRDAQFNILSESHFYRNGDTAPWKLLRTSAEDEGDTIAARLHHLRPFEILAYVDLLYRGASSCCTLNVPEPLDAAAASC